MLACLSVWSEVQMICIWFSWCHYHTSSLASLKFRIVCLSGASLPRSSWKLKESPLKRCLLMNVGVMIWSCVLCNYCYLLLPTTLAWDVLQLPPSVCPSIRRTVRLLPLYLLNWPLALIVCLCVGHYHGWQRFETEGHRSRSRSRHGRTDLDPRSSTVFCFSICFERLADSQYSSL